jgi:hypothetical protein
MVRHKSLFFYGFFVRAYVKFYYYIVVGRLLARIQDGQSSIRRLSFKVTDLTQLLNGTALLSPPRI